MDKLITKFEEGTALRFSVFDQTWTEAALEELWREHGVLFRADSVVPVLVRGKTLTLGIEDDGVLFFGPASPCFHVSWAPALIRTLTDAAERLRPEQKQAQPTEL